MLDDLSDVEIAARRGTAARTVQNQLSSVYRKLGVASRGELRLAAARRGAALRG